jgi:hypothetical protein
VVPTIPTCAGMVGPTAIGVALGASCPGAGALRPVCDVEQGRIGVFRVSTSASSPAVSPWRTSPAVTGTRVTIWMRSVIGADRLEPRAISPAHQRGGGPDTPEKVPVYQEG